MAEARLNLPVAQNCCMEAMVLCSLTRTVNKTCGAAAKLLPKQFSAASQVVTPSLAGNHISGVKGKNHSQLRGAGATKLLPLGVVFFM